MSAPLQLKPGKHNMASAAFDELRAARREGRTPEGAELSFGDVIDTLNPLQHLPVISEIYRDATGDSISPQARVAGGALYGGPIGLMASIASLAIAGNGEDGLGDRLFADLMGPAEAEKTPDIASNGNAAPEGAVVNLSGPSASRKTASLEERPDLRPRNPALAQTTEGSTQPLPRLSPEAFQALIGSFSNPEMMKADNSSLAAALEPQEDAGENTEAEMAMGGPSGDLAGAMQQALEKYEALKSVPPAAR